MPAHNAMPKTQCLNLGKNIHTKLKLSTTDYYALLLEQIDTSRTALFSHPVYTTVNDLSSLRVFMESHVFAVWDFMTLLKTLQRRLTGIKLPWIPPTDITAARLVNDIVLAEETDEIKPGLYLSHFDLYLQAMEEVGANREPIQDFINSLRQGLTPKEAIAPLPIPLSTKIFVLRTLKSAQGLTHEVAAAFLLGREDIIPSMFRQLLNYLEQAHGFSYEAFRLYLDRHTHLDEEVHAPMGQMLLKSLCAQDARKWEQARLSAKRALKSRHELWDGIKVAIDSELGMTQH